MRARRLSLLMVWTSFYEQLAWAPILVLFATAAGDPSVLALAASAYSLANLLGNIVFGHLADRLGSFRVGGLGFIGMAASAFLHLSASTPALLVIIRFIHGLTAAAVAPASFAALAEKAPSDRRGEVMARAGLLIAVASMLAPPITGRLEEQLGLGSTVWTLAVLLGVVGLVVLLARAEDHLGMKRARSKGAELEPGGKPILRDGDSLSQAREGLDLRTTTLTLTVGFAVMFGQNVLFYAFPIKGNELGLGSAAIGGLLSAFAVGALIAFLPPLSRTADRYGRFLPIIAGLALIAVGLLGLAPSTSKRLIAASLFLYGLGFGLAFPAVAALSADGSGANRRGFAFGLLMAAFSGGAILGPLVTRVLESAASPFTVAAWVAGAALAAVAIGRAWVVDQRPLSVS